MSASTVLAILFGVAALTVAGRAPVDARLRAATPAAGPASRRRWRVPNPVVAVLGGLGVAVLLGGLVGLIAGLATAAGALRVLPRLEDRATRARREALESQAPDLLDLLAACLASGATVPAAVEATAAALDPPAGEVLGQVAAALRWGADPVRAWEPAARHEPLRPLAVAVARSAESGAALAAVLPRVAADLREGRRSTVEVAVRGVGVRLTAPLGLAFLPAFVLLGVVPVVAALASDVLTGW